jgi:hypothetical protein
MADESLLRQAWLLYKQGRFAASLASLEPRVFQFRDDPEFFRIMGLCCLRLGDWKGGETYLQRSRQLDDLVHRDTLLGLLALSARKKDFPEALKLGLELLDRDPDDRTAKKAMAQLKASLAGPDAPPVGADVVAGWLPGFRKPIPGLAKWTLRIVVALVIAGGVALGTWWGLALVKGGPAVTVTRSGPPALTVDAADPVQAAGTFSVTLTAEEVKVAWDQARRAFQDYHDSRARYEINRLLLSNASPAVKERARTLLPYLHEPDFSRPEDSSSYQEVRVAPVLYEGCTVRWSGVLTNLVSGTTKITFDLLLGYQNGQVVEGIVPVELGFAALLKNSQAVEVLGKVALRDGRWYVQGTSLRDIGYRAP